MLAKDKLFRITEVEMESGCKKFILYKYFGWWHVVMNGSRYGMISHYNSFSDARSAVDQKYISYANSCTKSEEVQVWPIKEEK